VTKPIIKIVNTETGEEIEREMNADELAQFEQEATNDANRAEAKAAELAARDAAKAKLAALGLTLDDLAALGL